MNDEAPAPALVGRALPWRRRRDLNPCAGLCRPLPHPSATPPSNHDHNRPRKREPMTTPNTPYPDQDTLTENLRNDEFWTELAANPDTARRALSTLTDVVSDLHAQATERKRSEERRVGRERREPCW